MRSISETVKQLIIINVIFFIGSQFLGDLGYDIFALHYFDNDKFLISQLLPICLCMESFTYFI